MKNTSLNKDSLLLLLNRLQRQVRFWPRLFLLQHNRIVHLVILLSGAVVIIWILFVLLFTEPKVTSLSPSSPLPSHSLSTQTIDELELWIEERESERENELVVPAHVLEVGSGNVVASPSPSPSSSP
jgi:hypothetical protein